MALQLLSTLKGAALKQLAFKCGVSTSGVKAALCQRLQDEIPLLPGPKLAGKSGAKREPMRILSIDMGIRNLAYCVLDVPTDSSLPKLVAWKRIAVSSAPIPNDDKSELASKVEKESFEPPVLSAAAFKLLRKTLLPHNPTHILIERQRFRSMGSPKILEWTVRVNMLESMIYAILLTLREEGAWNGTVVPIAPGKVGPFWLEGEEATSVASEEAETVESSPASMVKTKTRNAKLAKALNKGAKIDLVRNWLAIGDRVGVDSPDVEALVKAYLDKWDKKPGGVKGKRSAKDAVATIEKMGKLDDLADSLLQGMAFIQWEENKRIAREYGISSLLEPAAK
jgi:cruciform cutting endonuclease 1